MANWYGTARSNYVRLKDPGAVRQLLAARAAEIELQESASQPGLFVFLVGGLSDSGGWPTVARLSASGEPDPEVDGEDFLDVMAEHLADGEVLITIEAGAEKLRYITGWAQAVRMHRGRVQRLQLSIADIYRLVQRRWKVTPTEALY